MNYSALLFVNYTYVCHFVLYIFCIYENSTADKVLSVRPKGSTYYCILTVNRMRRLKTNVQRARERERDCDSLHTLPHKRARTYQERVPFMGISDSDISLRVHFI